MPISGRDVIVLDTEDDASPLHHPIVPHNSCLTAFNNVKTKQDQHHQQSTQSNLKDHSVTSRKTALQDPSVGIPTRHASHDISQVSLGEHYPRGFSHSGTERPPQRLPRTVNKKTSEAYSLTKSHEPPYFTTPSWSFTAPANSHMDIVSPSSFTLTSRETPTLRYRESASSNMNLSRSSTSSRGPPLLPQSVITELTDSDDSTDEEGLALWMAQDAEDEMSRSSLASPDSKAAVSRRSSIVVPRNLPIKPPLVSLDTFTYKGINLTEKSFVELEDGDFLRIIHIVQDTSTSIVTLRGWKFRRTRHLNGVIDRKLNEVCWILHIDEDDPRDANLQSMETVPVCEIVKRRRIRLTNQSFPALSWRDDGQKENSETIENDRVLVCRFKYLCFYADSKARSSYNWHEKGFHRLREDECDQRPDNKMKDKELRNIWRGDTIPGGAQEGWLPGEREYLRQEDVSHRGIASRSSLKAPSGPDFPIGDPMKRGSVGSLVTEDDLHRKDQDRQNASIGYVDLVHMKTATRSSDDIEEISTSSISSSREQRRDRRRSQNFSGLNGISINSSDCDTDKDHGASALSRGQRQSSIQSREFKDRSPRIVEIDAQIKTSSSSGTFEKRYEGRVTSRYYPTQHLVQKKRSADISFGSPTRPMKRINRGFRAESSKADFQNRYNVQGIQKLSSNNRCFYHESTSSDSDRTMGRSQSPDIIQEMYTPSKPRGYRTTNSGLVTPVSERRDSALRQSRDIMLPPRMGGLSEHTPPSTPVSRTARSSVVDKTQACGTTEDDSGIVDLTRSQAIPYGSFSRARPSRVRRSDPISPSNARLSLSLDPNKTSYFKDNSSQPRYTHPSLNLKSHLTSTDMGLDVNPSLLGSLPITPVSSKASRVSSPLSSKATLGPSSRRTEKSCQQNRGTAIKSPATKASQRRYTFGDCFCGAGGMSRGAVSAGLRVKWGFDFNPAACQTYRMNFFGTTIYNVWANQFSEAKGDHKVDICHLSPPCQFFSDAHTIQGKDDDMNTASLFAIFNLLEKAKPRIVTLEQTSGLIRRHPIFFNAVINMFTSRGFSVRWKVMNCADFGLPQRRTRLLIMASCPGEALPPFPTPTHSSNPEKTGLKAWTTINEAIAKIPHGWLNHDVHLARERNSLPQSGDKIATCVTTSGGGIIHPSGKRDFTHREFACLQDFPLGHKFGVSGAKKQIGNAVPPSMAKVLLETVVKALLKADSLI